MTKPRQAMIAISLFAVIGALYLVAHGLTGAAQGNSGDVWVDNVGQPAGPGHEQDPHLQCADINLWGNGLADSSGTFTIDSWPPTGSGATAYGPAGWHYNTAMGGDQVLAVIPISALLAGSAANGDTPQSQQGLHFKLQFVQDPQKHKTFWVNCAATSPSASPTGTATPTPTASGSPTATPTGTATPTPSATVTPSPSGTAGASEAPSVAPSSSAFGQASPASSAPSGTLAGTGGGPGTGAGTGSTAAIGLLLLAIGGGILMRNALRK